MSTTTTTVTTDSNSIEQFELTTLSERPPSIQHRVQPIVQEQPGEALVAAEDESKYPTGIKFWLIILSVSFALILGGLDANIVATAVPSITDEFHTVADIGWYSSAFRLTTCAFQFMFGRLYKLFSVKKIWILTNVIFLVGSLLCATASSSSMFIVARAVTGLGFAGELSGCYALLVRTLPLRKRPVFAGTLACVESMALISAPIVGGIVTGHLGWRWCFWLNLPIGGAGLLTTIFFFKDPKGTEAPEVTTMTFGHKLSELDLLSNCLSLPSLTALFIALSWAGIQYPWTDGRIIGCFVVFVVLLIAFLYNQHRRGDSAVLPFRIIRQRCVIAGVIFTTCANSMMQVLEYYLPTYYQVARGMSPAESGIKMLPILVGMMIGLFIHGIGTTTIGYYTPFMILASICMPIAAGLMTTYSLDTTVVQFILYSGFAGFAGGIGFQGSQSSVQTSLPEADVTMGMGAILFGQNFGPALFIAVAQVLFTEELAGKLQGVIPGLPGGKIGDSGLSGLVKLVPMERWNEVYVGIDQSLTHTWYLAVALGCTTMVGSLLTDWRSVKQKKS